MTADLIAKLESADGPSRELDRDIALTLNMYPAEAKQELGSFTDPAMVCGAGITWAPPAFTSSLDAALTLVPEGHWWTAGDCRREKHARVAPEAVDDDGHEAFGATVAIALCIAALRARGEG